MTRILTTLAAISLTLLIMALLVGIYVGDLYNQPSPETLRWATVHRLTGIAAALGVVLVESVIATYFIGTSRWCKEVTETYKLDPAAAHESNRLKRRAFAVATIGMLTVVGVIALGAAADPATGRPNTAQWTVFHFSAAMVGYGVILWTYIAGWNYVWQNQQIIERIVAEVARIRQERGLG